MTNLRALLLVGPSWCWKTWLRDFFPFFLSWLMIPSCQKMISDNRYFYYMPSLFSKYCRSVSWKLNRFLIKLDRNGILLPKLFRLTVRKNCSSDREKLLKFETEGWEFANFLRSLEQFIQTVKGQNNFW